MKCEGVWVSGRAGDQSGMLLSSYVFPTAHVFAKIHCDVNIGLVRCLRGRLNPGQWQHNKPFLTQILTHRQQKKDSLLATDQFLFYI